ncbi:pilus assembly PilX N-terminal domain-containing protein [Thermodesulfovibrionales bacterium]|nr:pilus assembly PilX N-terminal domain-containing protein [Thermodesulfovibrionales bacterium]
MKSPRKETKDLVNNSRLAAHCSPLTALDQKGVALITALLMTIVVTAIGIAAVNIATVETRIAANHKVAKQAFYIAEAGIAHARANFDILRDDLDWSDNLPPDWPTRGTINVGGLTGTYTITTRDAALNSITVESTGTIAGATATVETLVERNTLPNVEAALGFVGDVGVSFSYNDDDSDGVNFLIDGGAYKFGITMSDFTDDDDGQSPQSIIGELEEDNMVDNVTGKGINASVAEVTETSDNITDFVSAMKNAADDENKITAPCHGNVGIINKGTVTDPKIVHINATGIWDCLKGNITGVGILIIEGDCFDFAFANGTIDWKGLVVITGNSVGGSLGNNVKIHGTLIINATTREEWRWFDIAGETELIYSQKYFDIARRIAPASAPVPVFVSSWR